MARAVDCRANLRNSARDARRSFVVNDEDRSDRVRRIGFEPAFDFRRVYAVAPITGNEVHDETQIRRHLAPERSEPSRFEH